MLRFLTVLLAAAGLLPGLALADDWQSGRFVLADWPGPPITVHFIEPGAGAMAKAPVVIVMHGVDRNADDYAANWQALAREHGLRIYAPEFSARDFPGAAFYNLGGIGTDGPFAYEAIEPLFDAIAARGRGARGYYLFGHSAGAQFVHRALLFETLPHLSAAYAANAGWYTLPDAETAWPYGLDGVSVGEGSVRAWLERPLVVMLGDRDTDPADPNLRQTPEAAAQGPHREARGEFFFTSAQARAAELGAGFAWRVVSVPGVAHDNAGMAIAAAALIAAEAQPSVEPDR